MYSSAEKSTLSNILHYKTLNTVQQNYLLCQIFQRLFMNRYASLVHSRWLKISWTLSFMEVFLAWDLLAPLLSLFLASKALSDRAPIGSSNLLMNWCPWQRNLWTLWVRETLPKGGDVSMVNSSLALVSNSWLFGFESGLLSMFRQRDEEQPHQFSKFRLRWLGLWWKNAELCCHCLSCLHVQHALQRPSNSTCSRTCLSFLLLEASCENLWKSSASLVSYQAAVSL